MSLHDALPVGSIVLPAYLTTPNKNACPQQDSPAAMPAAATASLKRRQALDAIVRVVTRLVETATFTLSAEDFSTLEHALQEYEASR